MTSLLTSVDGQYMHTYICKPLYLFICMYAMVCSFVFLLAVPAPEMPSVTPSDTSAVVTVSIPNGLCEGLRSGQITYEFKVYRNNSLVTTENVTTPFGPNATVTLYNLNSTTEYRLQIQGIIDVVSQSVSVPVTFKTLKGMFDIHLYVCTSYSEIVCCQAHIFSQMDS